eukprot:10106354-Alexandrium_andersonii.AAC.1
MLVSAAIRPNPQSAVPNMQHRFRRSNLELRGPKSASKLVPEAPEGCILLRCLSRFRICSESAKAGHWG